MQELGPTLPPACIWKFLRSVDDCARFDRQCARRGADRHYLVIDYLGAFLARLGTSLVAGLVIPVTLLITFIVLKVTGQTFNLMTLGGPGGRGRVGHR